VIAKSRGTLVIFAKVPQAGEVKTRLAPHFTLEQAADFYSAMLADVLAATAECSRALHLTPVVAVFPWADRSAVVRLAPETLRIVPQVGPDLGARMDWAVREAAAAGARRILLRGSDSPTLDAAAIESALAALDRHDLVLRPDRDGGYGLVGLRRPAPGLFHHPMSTSGVLDATLESAQRLGLRSHVTDPGFDIDAAPDLALLAAARRAGAAAICPRTLAYLDDHVLWPADGSPSA
jgi:rSAM/selenodomain-associated transferase 1